jgi:hypothetical protein
MMESRIFAEPVASLTVITTPPTKLRSALSNGQAQVGGSAPSSTTTAERNIERIPLWALAPGVGVLQGSTSSSIGVKLDDFSAINIEVARHTSAVQTPASTFPLGNSERSQIRIAIGNNPGGMVKQVSKQDIAGITTVRSTPAHTPNLSRANTADRNQLAGSTDNNKNKRLQPGLTVEAILHHPGSDNESTSSRPITPVGAAHMTKPNLHHIKQIPHRQDRGQEQVNLQRQYGMHLTPPDRHTPPAQAIVPPHPNIEGVHNSPVGYLIPGSGSWSTPRAKIAGWRKGRKEQVEDVLEEIGLNDDLLYQVHPGFDTGGTCVGSDLELRVEKLTLKEGQGDGKSEVEERLMPGGQIVSTAAESTGHELLHHLYSVCT